MFLESDFFLSSIRKRQLQQIQTFESLAAKFSRVLGSLQGVLDDSARSLILASWEDFNEEIRMELGPRPPLDFLRMEIVIKTVAPIPYRASYFHWYKKFLENHFSRQDLWKLLEENYVGKPLVTWPRYRTSFASTQHLFHIAFLREKISAAFDDVETVLEWGGGYGNFAKILLRYLGRQATYILIDTPLMTSVQWLYLSSVLGEESVNLVDDSSEGVKKGVINLVSLPFVNNIDEKPGLFVSTWGLSESSESAVDLVSSKGWLKSDHLLIATHKDDLSRISSRGNLSLSQKTSVSIIEMEGYPSHFYVIR